MSKTLVVPLEKMAEEPYALILCYPKASNAEIKKRLKELEKLNVSALEFVGEKQVYGFHILGKGCVGLVLLAYWKDKKVALKIRRVDADRELMRQEAKLLKKANSVQVGPKVFDFSKNFLLMQYIDGVLLPVWLEKPGKKAQIKRVLRAVLEQCWRLDEIGLDHGELSQASKHIIITKEEEPFIVDFESASLNRKPANVTSLCQFLFIGSEVAKNIAERLGKVDRKAIVEALKQYKKNISHENFNKVLVACRL